MFIFKVLLLLQAQIVLFEDAGRWRAATLRTEYEKWDRYRDARVLGVCHLSSHHIAIVFRWANGSSDECLHFLSKDGLLISRAANIIARFGQQNARRRWTERRLAVAMALHSRLGAGAAMHALSNDVLQSVFY